MINKAEMLDELIKSNKLGVWTDRLTSMFIELSNGVAHHRIFKTYYDKSDLSQAGLMHLLEIWKKYDVNNKALNPFGYFTVCLFRTYIKILSKEVKFTTFKNSMLELYTDEFNYMCNDDDIY